MLTKILYSYFTLANLIALANKIRSLLRSNFPEQQMIEAMLTNVDEKLENSVQAIGSTLKQPLTKEVREADISRDNSYVSLKAHIHAGLKRENESYRQACETLWDEFEKNNTQLYKLADGDETAAIESLVSDLRKAENQLHLETTHAVEWLDELENANKAFVTATQARSALRSTDDTIADKVAFKQLQEVLELLMNVLTALYAINDPEGIRGVVGEVNQYIREANASAKRGQSRPAAPGVAAPE